MLARDLVRGFEGDEIEIAHHGGEQIVEIMRQAAGQLTDRLGLLELMQPLLHRLAFLDLGGERARSFLDAPLERLVEAAELGDEALTLQLRRLAVADVDQHVDGADQRSRGVAQRRRIGDQRNERAVGALGNGLLAAHRPVLLDRDRHRAFVMRQRGAVGSMETPSDAPLVGADQRLGAGQLDRGLIIEGDAPVGIGGVDRRGERIEQLAVPALALDQQGFRPLRLGNIMKARHAAEQRALRVEQRIDIGADESFAVGSLDDEFASAHRLTAAQHLVHRTVPRRGFLGGDGPADVVEAHRASVCRRVSPQQFCCAPIAVDDSALNIAGTHPNRQRVKRAIP